jgi:molybdenum cofactor biosynthesis enzyme MoaA
MDIEKRPKPKTQKKKSQLSNQDKTKIWEILDSETPQSEMECIYDHDTCATCNSILITMDDGFPTCASMAPMTKTRATQPGAETP